MSGPKVVRIVTRDEILAICNGLLARLSVAIERWERIGIRNDTISPADVADVRSRAAKLKLLLDRDELRELQQRVPDEILWLEGDVERRLETARRKRIDERMKARRRQMLAHDLLAAHATAAIDAGLRGELQRVAQAQAMTPGEAEAILSGALRVTLVNADQPIARRPELAALAQRLAEGTKKLDLDQWLSDRDLKDHNGDDIAYKLDAALSDLEVIGAAVAADAFRIRAEAISREADTPQRRMRADTLLVDIGRKSRQRRNWLEQARRLEALVAEAIEIAGSVADSPVAEASLLLANEAAEPEALERCAERVREAVEEARNKLAGEARRGALLKALVAAGYEVSEGLGTASPSDGRLIFRRAANQEAGVEVSIPATGHRVQIRPVRFASGSSAPDHSCDRDIETAWCGDFDQMREVLKGLEANMTIERAMPVGATAVMVIADETAPRDDRIATPSSHRTTTRRS